MQALERRIGLILDNDPGDCEKKNSQSYYSLGVDIHSTRLDYVVVEVDPISQTVCVVENGYTERVPPEEVAKLLHKLGQRYPHITGMVDCNPIWEPVVQKYRHERALVTRHATSQYMSFCGEAIAKNRVCSSILFPELSAFSGNSTKNYEMSLALAVWALKREKDGQKDKPPQI